MKSSAPRPRWHHVPLCHLLRLERAYDRGLERLFPPRHGPRPSGPTELPASRLLAERLLIIILVPLPFALYGTWSRWTGARWFAEVPTVLCIGVPAVACVLLAHRLMNGDLRPTWEALMQAPPAQRRRSGWLWGLGLIALMVGSWKLVLMSY